MPPGLCTVLELPVPPAVDASLLAGADVPPCAVTTMPVVPADPKVVLPPLTAAPLFTE
jgi:hypothetical protein